MPRSRFTFPLAATACFTAIFPCGCGDDLVFRLPDPAVRTIAFGDSATKGPSERDYVTFLPGLLSLGSETFANEGDGGETSDEGIVRLRSLMTRGLFPNADVLLYWEGGNDLTDFIQETDPLLIFSPDSASYPFAAQLADKLDEVQANIETAIAVGQDAGLRVIVANYFFMPDGSLDCGPLLLDILLPVQAASANRYVTQLNERIRQAAANRSATLVDVAAEDAVLRGDSANYHNCNHLSADGNEIVAALIAEAMNQ